MGVGGSGKVGRKKGMMQKKSEGGLWETVGLEKGESRRKCSLGDE